MVLTVPKTVKKKLIFPPKDHPLNQSQCDVTKIQENIILSYEKILIIFLKKYCISTFLWKWMFYSGQMQPLQNILLWKIWFELWLENVWDQHEYKDYIFKRLADVFLEQKKNIFF